MVYFNENYTKGQVYLKHTEIFCLQFPVRDSSVPKPVAHWNEKTKMPVRFHLAE